MFHFVVVPPRSALTSLFVLLVGLVGLVEPVAAQAIPAFRVLHDEGGRLPFEDVRSLSATDPRWLPPPRVAPGFMPPDDAFWVRVNLPSGGGVLLLDSAETDDVRCHTRGPTGWRAVQTGDRRPFATRDVPFPAFAFRIPPSDGETVAYLRTRSEGTIEFPLRYWRTEPAFQQHAAGFALGLGAYYGLLAALGFYNLFLFFVIRQRGYLFYVLFLTCLSLFSAVHEGHATMLLWPASPWFAHVSSPLFLGLTYCFGGLYLREMTHIEAHRRWMSHAMVAGSAAYLVLALLSLVSYRWSAYLLIVASATTLLLGPVPAFVTWRAGWTPSRWVLLGLLAVVPPAALGGLESLGLLGPSWVTRHGFQLAVAVDAMCLSMALAERIRILQRREADARAEVIAQQKRVARATEQERRRIARDLHDGVGQQLSVLVHRLEPLDAELEGLARQTVGEVRRVSHDLHPHELERLGLSSALRQLADRSLDAAGLEAEVLVEPLDELIPEAAWLTLYRVAQEALQNTIRHAEATHVTVALRRIGPAIELRVEDDGRGLEAGYAAGIGLASMHERAELIGMRCKVEPAPYGGTSVVLTGPLDTLATTLEES